MLAEVRDAHQQVRLGGLAGAEHAIDVGLPVDGVARAQQRRAEQVGIRESLPEQRLARLGERDDLLVVPDLQVAVGEDEIRVARLRVRGI